MQSTCGIAMTRCYCQLVSGFVVQVHGMCRSKVIVTWCNGFVSLLWFSLSSILVGNLLIEGGSLRFSFDYLDSSKLQRIG
jgi:hypothetical protein